MDSHGTPARPEELLAQAAWARSLARSLVSDAAAADDVVQETWRAALARPPSSERPLRPWLARVIANFARQRSRSEGRRGAREHAAARPEGLPGPDELIERLDSQRALVEELARLDEPERSTVLLRYFEDLEPSEIARRQGLPPGTVRWRLKKGLDQLRERLDARFGDRRTWALLFVPLARLAPVPVPAPPLPSGAESGGAASGSVVTSGGAGAALTGAWIVSTTLKVAAGAAAATLAFLGLAWTGVVPRAISPFAREAPARVGFRPLAERGPEVLAATPEASAPAAETERRSAAPSAPAVVEEQPAVAAEATAMTLRAGLFDAGGAPLSGGHLTMVSPRREESPPSGADGSLELVLDGPDLRTQLAVRVERQGYASVLEEIWFAAGEVVHLGNFRLDAGGAISGRVVDADGRGVPDVLLTIDESEETPWDLDARRYEFFPNLRTSAASQPDGSFLLHGVPEGFHRVWASGKGWIASFGAPVEVRAGQESTGLELVLEPMSSAYEVTGTVRDPAGLAVPEARLDFRKEHDGSSMSGQHVADEAGRFRFVVAPGARLALTASDPAGVYGPASLDGLRGGANEITLRLTELRSTALAALGDDGEPLAEFEWRVLGSADNSWIASGRQDDGGEGVATLRIPSVAFRIDVWAPGHSLESVGPLRPEAVGPLVEVRLRTLPGLRGRVLADGAPLARAQVELIEELPAGRSMEHNGFPVYLQSGALDETASGDDGGFLLTPRRAGTFYVRVEAAGYAPAEIGPLALDPARGNEELEVHMGRGGAIEGRVIVPPGPDAGGRIVGISRGDCHAVTQRAAPDGTFRFEGLTPGAWQVRVVEAEIHPSQVMTRSSDGDEREELEFDCVVDEGRTTRFDIDLTGRGSVRITGLLRIDGAPPGAWKAMLTRADQFGGPEFDSSEFDVEGGFTLVAPKPGTYRVLLMGPTGQGGMQLVSGTLEAVAGDNPWQFEYATGAVEVRNVPPNADDGNPEHLYVWQSGEAVFCATALVPVTDGVALLPHVPLGPGRVVALGDEPRYLESWITLATCEVTRAETAQVTLP